MKTSMTQNNELLFIDANVTDAQSLVASISSYVDVVLLDNQTNVITQITAALDGRKNLDAIHLVSHGSAGELAFANGVLNNANMTNYASELHRIGSALSATGDLLLYGCEVAKGNTGFAFIHQLSTLTGADVAASDDVTGNIALGGNGRLEATTGIVETSSFDLSTTNGFNQLLTSMPTFTTGSSVVSANGEIAVADELDTFQISLLAGREYVFTLNDSGNNALGFDSYLSLLNSSNEILTSNDDASSNTYDSEIRFMASSTATYSLQATEKYSRIGSYVISAKIENSTPTGSLAIIGTPIEGQNLTINDTIADSDGFLSAKTYQWWLNNSVIQGATQSHYTPAASDVDSVISVTVTYTDNLGVVEKISSEPVSISAKPNNPPAKPTNAIVLPNGTEDTAYLINSADLLRGFTDADNDPFSIENLTVTNGTLTESDENWTFMPHANFSGAVNVNYNVADSKDASVSAAPITFTVLSVNDSPTGMVTIAGESIQKQTLTVMNTLADADGLGEIRYQWLSNGVEISGATQTTYFLTQADVGKIITVKASYLDGLTKTESVISSGVTVLNVNDLPTGAISITGTTTQGQVLTASNSLTDVDGLGAVSYQWLSGDSVILGATQSTYMLTATDVGKAMSVKASYTDLQHTVESVTSNPTALIVGVQFPLTGNVTISGTAQQHQTLTASNTLADANGLGVINYQWLSNGAEINGANQATYSLTQADVGKLVSVTASYTDGLNKLESKTSSAMTVTNVNDLPTGSVTISGEAAQQGKTLTASNDIADVDGLGIIHYQWLKNGSLISGATQNAYTLTASDVGKMISVKASYTDGFNKTESVTSNPTEAVLVSANEPPTGSVTITGNAEQKQTLTATHNLADINGLGTIKYQWLSNDIEISGKTQSTYTLTQTEVGKTITLKASYIDGLGKVESVTSAGVTVKNVNELPTGSVSILGTTKQGDVLTASHSLADADGLGEINYQWLSNGAVISGATQTTYTLTQADVGKTMSVTASYLDAFNTPESKTSSAITVTNLNDAPTGTVTIAGTPTQGQMLTATHSLADADGLGIIHYQWLKNGTVISGATQNAYTLTEKEVGKTISVKASYTDGFNKAESVTSPSTDAISVQNNEPPAGRVIITGIAQKGATLTVTHDLSDINGLGTMKYQWLSNGVEIKGKNQTTYTLTQVDVGKNISVQVSYTDGLNKIESVFADSVNVKGVNNLPTGSVTITGDLMAGQLLTAQNTLNDADGLGKLNYQWLRAGKKIDGATFETYTLSNADANKKISVVITYIDGVKNTESKTSSETASVKADPSMGLIKTGDAGKNKLIGAAKNDALSGLAGADTLRGEAGDDTLDGGAGNDSLDSGNGNDKLVGGDGNDTLLAGSGHDALDGGKNDDKLVGDKGNDTLNGGLGVDSMDGGVGDDYYMVENKKDLVIEAKSAGTDTIESNLTYTLDNNIENLILSGIANNTGTGNELNNQITGNAGDNQLNGELGNDKLIGGAGADILDGGKGMDTLIGGNDDDTYFMNNTEDKIIEDDNGGKDQIIASVSFELSSSNVEILTLSGAKAINGTGDEFNNLLQESVGGKIANVFDGKAGDDTINGEGGNDTLEGGEGDDVIDGGEGKDTAIFNGIYDDYQVIRNPDTDGVAQLIVSYEGNDKNINEGKDTLTGVEVLRFADGETVNVSEVPINDSSSLLILIGVIA